MLEARSLRIPPGTDTKQLTSWNALCIDGFSRAGVALDRGDWIETAETTLEFVVDNLWQDEQLFAVYANDEACFPAYLDDHAFLLKAALSLLQARWNPEVLSFSTRLADTMIARFEDIESGGFFFSASDQNTPISRLRSLQDDATPGGNGIAAIALEMLGHLTANGTYLDSAAKAIMSSYSDLQAHPLAHASLLISLDHHLKPVTQVILSGTDNEELKSWKAVIDGIDRVNCYVLGSGSGKLPAIPGLNESGEQTVAYICEGLRCLPPVHSISDLEKQLELLD